MRYNLAKNSKKFPIPNLSSSQKESYNTLIKEGFNELLKEFGTIIDESGRGWELTFSNPTLEKPVISLEEAIRKGKSYEAPWYLTATLKDAVRRIEKVQNIYMGDIPLMTDTGTFIINGTEKIVQHQLVRAEGSYFTADISPMTRQILGGVKIQPKIGSWVEIETSRTGVLSVKIDKKRKFTATTLLRVFGIESDDQIRELFKDVDINPEVSYIESTIVKDPSSSKEEAAIEIFRKMKPGEPLILEDAQRQIDQLFFDPNRYSLGKVGRFKINQKFGLDTPNDDNHRLITKEDLVEIIKYIIKINNGLGQPDDIDHLGNRRLKSVGELLQIEVRRGYLQLKANILEKISLQQRESFPEPSVLISTKPVSSKIQSFFNTGRSTALHEQFNPLTRLDYLRRMNAAGLTKERAGLAVRDVHYSQYGKICAVRTPEGASIGLTTFLSIYARINEYGFIETPYFVLDKSGDKVKVTDQVVYLAAYDEDNSYIIGYGADIDEKGFIVEKQVPLRKKGQFILGDPAQADYIDVDSAQVIGITAGLIPFIQSDDVTRTLMASSQLNQAVPLIKADAPLVGTGIEEDIAKNSEWIQFADKDGVVEYADSSKVIVRYSGDKELTTYNPTKFRKSNQNTNYNQKVTVNSGQKVKAGEILFEGPSISNGELAIGANVRAAYMVWSGYEFEDGIVISDRLVKEDILTSIKIEIKECEVVETKLGNEEITRDIPNVSEDSLRHLDKHGIIAVGSEVFPGDILVGKVAPKGEGDLSAEERLLRAIFGEKAKDVRNTSLSMDNGEKGTVIEVRRLSRKDSSFSKNGVIEKVQVFIAQQKKIEIGDKLAGRHGNKGVISAIVPEIDMPHMEDGTTIDIIFSAESVLKRMNLGQTFEAPLGLAGRKLGKRYTVPVLKEIDNDIIAKELEAANIPANGKVKLVDGRTGEFFDRPITVGETYILKLHHMSEDKIHARSVGPYNLIHQQPQQGKQNMGGQRLGEMEVWALQAYSAANLLQEMLTIKSDDMIGRDKAYRAILEGQPIPEPTVPESFKLLVRELNGLGLGIDPLEAIRQEVEDVVTPETPLVDEESTLADEDTEDKMTEGMSEVDDKKDVNFENMEEIE
jgi:DNA-directed RNA polymerase subunit beta